MLDNFISSNLLHLTVQPAPGTLPCVGSWSDRLVRLQEMLDAFKLSEGTPLDLSPFLRLLSPQQRRRHPPVRDIEWSQFEAEWLPKMQSLVAERLFTILNELESLPRGSLCPLAEAMAACRRIKNTRLFSLMIRLDPDCLAIIGSLAVDALRESNVDQVDLASALIRSGKVDCLALEDLIVNQADSPPILLLAILQQPPSFSPHWSAAHWILSRTLSTSDPLFEEFVRWSELATHPFKPRWSIHREVKVLTVEAEAQVSMKVSDPIPMKRSSTQEDEWPELHLE